MATSHEDALIAVSVGERAVRADGHLTMPRSYGVYRLTGSRSRGRVYRFGNHPARLHELIAEYGGATLEALFLERRYAEELAALRNRLKR
jgi:hypothetical protein